MKIYVSILLAGLFLIGGLTAQTAPQPEVVVMDVGMAQANQTVSSVSGINEKIREIFVKVGRFQVLGLNVRLDGVSAGDLVKQLRARKEAQASFSKEV